MKRFFLLTLIFGLVLSSCSPFTITRSQGEQPTPVEATMSSEDGQESQPEDLENNEPSPAMTPDVAGFEERLQLTLIQHNPEQMRTLMEDNFLIAVWQSEGVIYSADESITQLLTNYLAPTHIITFNPAQDIAGFDPQGIVGPDIDLEKAIFTSGWGLDGKSEAVLFVAQRPNGMFYWYGVLISPEGFTTEN